MTTPTIRFWCSVDETPLGKTSLAYADAFAGMGFPLRLIATKMGALAEITQPGASWGHHRGAFLTPVASSYINVVCGTPSDWKRLYTVGVKNVLIADTPPKTNQMAMALQVPIPDVTTKQHEHVKLDKDELALEVALKYQTLIVPNEEISEHWKLHGATPVVIPTELGKHALELRSALIT